VWIVEKEGDLPDWMLIGNPRVRHIPIAKPDHQSRRVLAASMMKGLTGFSAAPPAEQAAAIQTFVDETDSLLLLDVQAIVQLGRSEGVPFSKISDAVRRYKVGVTEDPWSKIDRTKILDAADFISRRVKGQAHAVTHVLDIIKRAVVGFGGTRRGGRPRGVVFLAGPTGVGKTELAKTITSLLFGDETAYIRFDMSEFSAEHSDQRLIGAPPGYVGYDVGGELTNAVREKPFSVVLFDEIEKAHPKILDKFLQVLDDGVLTSGREDRVYFSETLIIFTSNLGIYHMDADGQRVANVSANDDFEVVQKKVKGEIENHFKSALNRPELLNRIGDNVIVFDFIRENIASDIFDGMYKSLLSDLQSQLGIEISLCPDALDSLKKACLADLSNGGRGIRNKVESNLINPLARAMFDGNAASGEKFEVTSIEAGQVVSLKLERQ
jgi:ATP-dependent Clp protease ATP-binding subunit ClpA